MTPRGEKTTETSVPKVIFIEHNGTEHLVQGEVGQNLMQVATSLLIPGIVADCGGYCNCATCHAYIAPEWIGRVPEKSRDEADLLECALDTQENSRLTCQVTLTPELDGVVVRLPRSQT